VLYLEDRNLIDRHRIKPFLIRIKDAPGEDMPIEGLRLEPMAAAARA